MRNIFILLLIFSSCNEAKKEKTNKEIVLEIEDFFNQNNCEYIIGANLEPEVSLYTFRSILKKIKLDKRTSKIAVRISDSEDNCNFSDAVYIIGTWNVEDLKQELKQLVPTEIYRGFLYKKPKELLLKNKHDKVYTVWWD